MGKAHVQSRAERGRGRGEGESWLRTDVARLRPEPRAAFDLKPATAFEIAVAERLPAGDSEVDQLPSRLNWLLTIVIGAAVNNIVIALLK